MKKTLTVFSLIALLFTACSSDDNPILSPEVEVNPTLQEVTFNIKGFDVGYTEMGMRATSVSPEITDLYYFVFNKSDNKLFKEKHLKGNNVLTELKDSLPQGDYYISIFAAPIAQNGLVYNFDISDSKGYDKSYVSPTSQFSDFGKDSFYETFHISIRESSLEKDVILERITGGLDIIIDDANLIPDNILNVFFCWGTERPREFYLKSEEIRFGTLASWSTVPALYTLFAEIDKRELLSIGANLISSYSLGYSSNISSIDDVSQVYVYFLYEDGTRSTPKLIKDNLKVYKNKVTTIKGKLFNPTDNSFNISINDVWEEGPIEEFEINN